MITPRTTCPRCHRSGVSISTKHPVCPPCQAAVRQEAAHQQERDYLARYLATRDDDHGREATRLRALAKRLGVDWHDAPATMLHFDARVAALLAPYGAGNKRGRPAGAHRERLNGRGLADDQRTPA